MNVLYFNDTVPVPANWSMGLAEKNAIHARLKGFHLVRTREPSLETKVNSLIVINTTVEIYNPSEENASLRFPELYNYPVTITAISKNLRIDQTDYYAAQAVSSCSFRPGKTIFYQINSFLIYDFNWTATKDFQFEVTFEPEQVDAWAFVLTVSQGEAVGLPPPIPEEGHEMPLATTGLNCGMFRGNPSDEITITYIYEMLSINIMGIIA